jgi:hypothetical protein
MLKRAAATAARLHAGTTRLRRALAFIDRFSPRVSSRAYHAADAYLEALGMVCEGLEGALAIIGARLSGRPGAPGDTQLDADLDRILGLIERRLRRGPAATSSAGGEHQGRGGRRSPGG